FDQADVRLLVRLVGERTGRKFVVDDEVSGKVTVVTPGAIPAADVYPLLLSVLESSGYSVIEREDAAYVVPLPKGGLTGAPVVTDENAGRSHGVITRVFRISHVSAVELKRLLEPLIRGGKEGAVAAFGSTNHLLITDTEENIRQAEKIIRELDQPGSARMVEVVALKYASAVELAQQLVAAISGSESAGARVSRHLQQVGEGAASLPSGLIVVPATQANSIVVVGARVEIDEAKRIIALMDVEAPSGYGRLNAIFLRYLTAEDAAKTLNALLAKKVDKDQRQPIAIEPNAANNALVVDATPQDFAIVKKLVDELDQVPQQVMVEVLIAEVSLNKNLDLGVDLASIEIPDDEGAVGVVGRSRPGPSDTLMEAIEQGIFPQGLALGVAKGTYVNAAGQVVPRIPILIRALAQNRDVNILSSIPLWAQNNTEASVSIVENIPILRSTIEGGSGTARDVIQNIDRVDVGIKLKFTPHVNPNNEVLMQLNPSIEAILDEGPEGTQFAPTIAKREVSTTVTVPDKATIIISGLMRQDSVSELSKVPFLGDLPVIGWLFQSRRNRSQKTNLLIFVTPHIVTDMNRAIEMKQSLEKKTGINPVFETMEKQK
ncbi:MAG TPA: secretin N-terminal domain-containing protein, partial [Kiritimatiellia bacterium]